MKILYGVPSEGMGHATRSKVVVSHLVKSHDVRIVTSDRAYQFMNKFFPGKVYKIRGFHIAYKNAAVSRRGTVSNILKNGPKDLIENFNKYREIHREFKPDIVISDFESFSYYFAKFHKIPIISIDNMQIITRCNMDISIPKEERPDYLISRSIINSKLPGCNHYLITSFFDAEIRKKNTYLVPPILRDEIIDAETEDRDHIIVYQTSTSQKNIISMLQRVSSDRFMVYGFNKNEDHSNVFLRPFSEDEFINDLAAAKAVITNGGFSLISEAVYLKKPVCSIPIKKQFEQFVNAAYIEKCGLGRHFDDFSSDAVKSFLYDLKKFKSNVNRYYQDGNEITFKKINEILDREMNDSG